MPTPIRGIYRRGDIYWLNFQRNGRRQFISLETSDIATAIERAAEIRANPELSGGGAFISEIEAYLAYKRRKNVFTAASVQTRRYVLAAFGEWCGKSPAAITPADVTAFYRNTLERLEISTSNSYAMMLKSFFAWCVNVARIRRTNPCDGLDMSRADESPIDRFCTPAERDRLIDECPTDDLRFVLFCGFHAGLRKNEIIEARPFWFDLDAGLLHLRKTATIQFKDREERTVPLKAAFRTFLDSYGLREPFMLAPNVKHGRNRYRYDFIRPFSLYMRAQGLPWVTPHIMRHTFASLLASAGVSLYKIAKWLGDDSRVVEKRYAKLLPNDPDIERDVHSGNSPAERRSQHLSS